MHICLLSVEIFAWGKFGGFGKATRLLGRELVKRGCRVSALVPRRKSQRQIEVLDGITVYGYDLRRPFETMQIFKNCDADIFHSQEPNFGTYLAQQFHPNKAHIVTFRDTRLVADWLVEFRYPTRSRIRVLANMLFEDNFLVRQAVRKCETWLSASNILVDRAFRKYRLEEKPTFLPTPVEMPAVVEKAEKPTVCFVSRWERRKRPEILINLARSFPEIEFLAVGASRDPKYDSRIRAQLRALPNVEVYGIINQFESSELSRIFSRSWILLNTSAREGLPNTFIEACAHKCAILSSVDPDNFTSKFGCLVSDDNFGKGLSNLLENDRWQSAAKTGFAYVEKTFSVDNSLDQHLSIYTKIMKAR